MEIKSGLVKIVYYENGAQRELTKSEFDLAVKALSEAISKGREMPCIYVSLDREMKKELQREKYIELYYAAEKTEYNGLTYERLLLKVDSPNCLNFTRYYKGKYEGRNIYYDLNEINY